MNTAPQPQNVSKFVAIACMVVGVVSAAVCVTVAIVSKSSHVLIALGGPVGALTAGGSLYAKRARAQQAQKR